MINPATRPYDELNDFTQNIKDNPGTKVLLRDGRIVEPIFEPAEDEYCLDVFAATQGQWSGRWELNGKSVTRPDYDMMEIVK